MKQKPNGVQKKIDRMVRRIVRRFHPERIILFGSHARGTATADSDVDLLVVMPVKGSKLDKQIEIRNALHTIRAPKDVFVVTPDEAQRFRHIIGTLVYPAFKEGKELYVRQG